MADDVTPHDFASKSEINNDLLGQSSHNNANNGLTFVEQGNPSFAIVPQSSASTSSSSSSDFVNIINPDIQLSKETRRSTISCDYLAMPKEISENPIKDDKKTKQLAALSQNFQELPLQQNIRGRSSHVPIHHHLQAKPQSWHRSIYQGKPIEYWQDKWQTARGSEYDKALSLLIEYSGGYKTLIGPGYWCYSIGRFFKGHWNTHHGTAVSRVIDIHKTLASTVDVDGNSRTVTNLLEDLRTKLDDSNLKSEGDLARILTVIKNNTDIDYKQVSLDRQGVKALQPTC